MRTREMVSEEVMQEFRFALAWGLTYGPLLSAQDWEKMRDEMAAQFTEKVLEIVHGTTN